MGLSRRDCNKSAVVGGHSTSSRWNSSAGTDAGVDTTDNKFRDDLLTEPLNIQRQVAKNGGYVPIPDVPGHGAEPNREFLEHFALEV